jgi:hypothetical protein
LLGLVCDTPANLAHRISLFKEVKNMLAQPRSHAVRRARRTFHLKTLETGALSCYGAPA